jgi:ribose 1,5-bisphosphokinase
LSSGAVVVCNVSRGVVEAARRRWARVLVVEVTAPADVLARRLADRGREPNADQAGRLLRLAPPLLACDVRIENTGTVADGVAKLIGAIRSARTAAA